MTSHPKSPGRDGQKSAASGELVQLRTPPVAANTAHAEPEARNPGLTFDPRFLDELRHVNLSALERRASTMTKRRWIKGDNQAAWLLKSLAVMDLTTLNSNDTDERVRRLCAKALNPLSRELREGLGLGERVIRPAAVCVYHPSSRPPHRRWPAAASTSPPSRPPFRMGSRRWRRGCARSSFRWPMARPRSTL